MASGSVLLNASDLVLFQLKGVIKEQMTQKREKKVHMFIFIHRNLLKIHPDGLMELLIHLKSIQVSRALKPR